jgi:hypothetical protein
MQRGSLFVGRDVKEALNEQAMFHMLKEGSGNRCDSES